jgi:hypothetical protein
MMAVRISLSFTSAREWRTAPNLGVRLDPIFDLKQIEHGR